MPTATIIQYAPQLQIVNIHTLPTGTGARYLLVIQGEGKDLVAKKWLRHLPKHTSQIEMIIVFSR